MTDSPDSTTRATAARVGPMATGANETPDSLDLSAIRARCGKGHTSLRRLAERAAYCVDPLSDGGVAAAHSMADIPFLIAEVERLRHALEARNGI